MQDNDDGKEGCEMTTMVLAPALPRIPRVDGAVVRQLARYGVVGVLGTVVSALLYLLFRVWWDAVPANLAALVLSTVASTEANRRFTFRGVPTDRTREYLQNAATVAFYAVYSSAVLLLLDALVDDPTALQESVTVAAASVLGGLARFAVLRNWVFGDESRHGGAPRVLPGPRPLHPLREDQRRWPSADTCHGPQSSC
jgi:putative flippase GtrA